MKRVFKVSEFWTDEEVEEYEKLLEKNENK